MNGSRQYAGRMRTKKRMSIYYKSRTEKTFSKIDIPESYINVLELKKRLIEKNKIDMKRDFKFTLTDESGENGMCLKLKE